MVLEKTLENPLDCKEIQPVHPKGDHPWMFIRRTDVEAETPVKRWPPAATWMDLGIMILNEVRKGKTNTMRYHLYMESKI